MLPLNSAELADMQATQQDAMMDECCICRWTPGASDQFNLPSNATYPADPPIPCGLVFGNSNNRELMQASEVPAVATAIRLPLGTTFVKQDRVKVTKRFGVGEASVKTYNLIGLPKAGPSGLLVNIELVTDGSDA